MQITFIRHGESEANVGHFINDDPNKPVHLTAKGKAQAEALAAELSEEHYTHAYVSEFPRAQQTLAILLRDRDLLPGIDPRLNERSSGMDGQPVHEFNDQVLRDPLHFKTTNGESFLEQMQRLRDFLDEIAARHPNGKVLAVSHENPILAALGLTTSAQQVVLANLANCGRIDLEWPQSGDPS
jgi:broad specificity phosphatase PhoE